MPTNSARVSEDAWDPDRLLVRVELSDKPVFSPHEPVVGREDYDRVVREPQLLELFEDAIDGLVDRQESAVLVESEGVDLPRKRRTRDESEELDPLRFRGDVGEIAWRPMERVV
ncbi:MAG: hypothetical protein P8R42_30040 [Candidatus Binatia bacterium]|nr:hypothetical protein [Candidatus Binatia bacterium]